MIEIRCDDSFRCKVLCGSVSLDHAVSLETHCVTGDTVSLETHTLCHWRHTVSLETRAVSLETLSLETHAVALETHAVSLETLCH